MKKLVSLKLSKQPVPVKIENGRHTINVMGGNPSFLSPFPTMLVFGDALSDLETAYINAMAGGRLLIAILHEKEAVVDTLYTQLAHYVETIANGDGTIILSAGMNVRLQNGGRKFTGLVIKNGDLSGTMNISTGYEKNHAYMWQMVQDPLPADSAPIDPAHAWELIGVTIKASFTKEGLEAGKKYWFRVASVGKDGQNAWSDPLCKMATE